MSKKNNIKIITFANIQIDLYLILNQSDLNFLNLEPNFINEINNLFDLENWFNQFHVNENNTDVNLISNLLKIESNNFIINTCLYINRIYKEKVDFDILSNMLFYEEDLFLKKLLKIACEKNNLFMKNLNINLECPEIKFTIKIITNEGKTSNSKSFSNKKFLNKEENEINIYSNLENLINSFNFNNKDYFLFDLNSYIINSNNYIKNNNSTLNIIIQNIYTFLISIIKFYKKIKHIIIFPKLNIECLYSINSISITFLKEIIKISHIFYIEKRISNLIYEIFSNNNNKLKTEPISLIKLLSKENNNQYIKGYDNQIGIFFDNFIEISLIEQEISSGLILSYGNYKFDIFDKNERQHESELVLKENYFFFESLNLSGILSRLINKRKLLTCHLAGNLLVKRFLELKKHKLELCIDDKFYLIKIKRKKDTGLKRINESKEADFLLDCINKNSSSLKKYNPLFDKNLFQFFQSKLVKNHLSRLGFINKKGEILDPDKIENSKYKKNKIELYNNEKRKMLYFQEKKENITHKINLLDSIIDIKKANKIQKKLPSIFSFSKDISDLYSLHGGKINKKSK